MSGPEIYPGSLSIIPHAPKSIARVSDNAHARLHEHMAGFSKSIHSRSWRNSGKKQDWGKECGLGKESWGNAEAAYVEYVELDPPGNSELHSTSSCAQIAYPEAGTRPYTRKHDSRVYMSLQDQEKLVEFGRVECAVLALTMSQAVTFSSDKAELSLKEDLDLTTTFSATYLASTDLYWL
jgi:hypothetical protein